MKSVLIKFILLSVFILGLISRYVYPIDSLIVDKDDYELIYIGNQSSMSELKSKFIAGYTFVNIPLDSTFYKQEYPNPFAPSTVKEKFIFRLEDDSDVNIIISDNKDSVFFNLMFKNQAIGYYYFMLYDFNFSSFRQKVLSSLEDIRIVFLIKEKRISIPLRNIDLN